MRVALHLLKQLLPQLVKFLLDCLFSLQVMILHGLLDVLDLLIDDLDDLLLDYLCLFPDLRQFLILARL